MMLRLALLSVDRMCTKADGAVIYQCKLVAVGIT